MPGRIAENTVLDESHDTRVSGFGIRSRRIETHAETCGVFTAENVDHYFPPSSKPWAFAAARVEFGNTSIHQFVMVLKELYESPTGHRERSDPALQHFGKQP